jgi:hypothetical protein
MAVWLPVWSSSKVGVGGTWQFSAKCGHDGKRVWIHTTETHRSPDHFGEGCDMNSRSSHGQQYLLLFLIQNTTLSLERHPRLERCIYLHHQSRSDSFCPSLPRNHSAKFSLFDSIQAFIDRKSLQCWTYSLFVNTSCIQPLCPCCYVCVICASL